MFASRKRQLNSVLVVDDFAPFRRHLRSRLEEAGFQTVVEATDGLEAVAKAAELQPALVLLDIAMPNLDGLKAATQIRSLAPKAKILFVSGNTDSDVVREALGIGAAGYLSKSGLHQELLSAVEAILAGKKYICSECASHGAVLASPDVLSEFS